MICCLHGDVTHAHDCDDICVERMQMLCVDGICSLSSCSSHRGSRMAVMINAIHHTHRLSSTQSGLHSSQIQYPQKAPGVPVGRGVKPGRAVMQLAEGVGCQKSLKELHIQPVTDRAGWRAKVGNCCEDDRSCNCPFWPWNEVCGASANKPG